MKCRLVDADGPLARLKKAIFNPELYENIAEWIVVRTESAGRFLVFSLRLKGFVMIPPPGSLVGRAADGHRSHHAHGGFH